MIEPELIRRAKYRRTWNLIHRWKCPDDVTPVFVEWPKDLRIDVILSVQGKNLSAPNFEAEDFETAKFMLDYLAAMARAQASAAYDDHEVAGPDDLKLDMALAAAARRFREGMDGVSCKGKGGDE